MDMKTLLIVPAYNEEASIGKTLDELAGYDFFDVLVIDDGSVDATAKICAARGVKCIRLPFNMGLSGAFETGMRYAFCHNYDAAIQFDADGQHRPEYIAPLLEKLGSGMDIVIGSRFTKENYDRSMRQFGAAFIRMGIRLTTGRKITDPTSGMRAYSRRIIRLFAKANDLTPEPDTLVFLMRYGAKVCEVEVEMKEREFGQSYLNTWSSMKYMIRMALSIFLIQFARPGIRLKEETAV